MNNATGNTENMMSAIGTDPDLKNTFVWKFFCVAFLITALGSLGGAFAIHSGYQLLFMFLMTSFFYIKTHKAFIRLNGRTFACIVLFGITSLIAYIGYYNLRGMIFVFIQICLFALLFLLKPKYKQDLIEKCTKIFTVLVCISLGAWLLVKFGNFPLSWKVTIVNEENIDVTKYVFRNYFFFWEFHYEYFGWNTLNRFQAFLLEPSTCGKACLFFLVINGLDFKKRSSKILFFIMLLSCSLAAYLIFCFAMAVKLFMDKNFMLILWSAVLGIATLLILYFAFPEDSAVHTYIFNRFQNADRDEVIQYNRSTPAFDDYFYNQFCHSRDLFLGDRGFGEFTLHMHSVDFKAFIFRYGIITAFLLFLLLFTCFLACPTKKFSLMLATYIITILPSSHLWNYFFYFGMLILAFQLSDRSVSKEKKPSPKSLKTESSPRQEIQRIT